MMRIYLSVCILFLAACSGGKLPDDLAKTLSADAALSGAQQVIFVTNAQRTSVSGVLTAFENSGGSWKPVFSGIPVALGKKGIAPAGAKREGDGRTPEGGFRIGEAFGYAEKCDTKLVYRQSTSNDFWIDDVSSPDYNRRVNGAVPAVSHEKMLRKDDLYQWGAVVEYNTSPVVPGNGSAIFLHVWRAPGSGTAGCIAMPEADILRLLAWLDPAKTPALVVQGGNK